MRPETSWDILPDSEPVCYGGSHRSYSRSNSDGLRNVMTLLKCSLLSAIGALLLLTALSPAGVGQQGSAPAASQPNDTDSAGKTLTEYAPPQEKYQRAVAYSHERYRHFFLNALYGWLVLLCVFA